MNITNDMIEDGCRGMYGPSWDGPPEKMPGEKMKDVWRKLSKACLEKALARDEIRKAAGPGTKVIFIDTVEEAFQTLSDIGRNP